MFNDYFEPFARRAARDTIHSSVDQFLYAFCLASGANDVMFARNRHSMSVSEPLKRPDVQIELKTRPVIRVEEKIRRSDVNLAEYELLDKFRGMFLYGFWWKIFIFAV